jgi:hypothetical protein
MHVCASLLQVCAHCAVYVGGGMWAHKAEVCIDMAFVGSFPTMVGIYSTGHHKLHDNNQICRYNSSEELMLPIVWGYRPPFRTQDSGWFIEYSVPTELVPRTQLCWLLVLRTQEMQSYRVSAGVAAWLNSLNCWLVSYLIPNCCMSSVVCQIFLGLSTLALIQFKRQLYRTNCTISSVVCQICLWLTTLALIPF